MQDAIGSGSVRPTCASLKFRRPTDAWLVGPISRPQLKQEAFSARCVEGASLPDQ